jgi:hypothetical protein
MFLGLSPSINTSPRLVGQRITFHEWLAEADPTQNRFLQGWLNTVENLKTPTGIA